MRWKDKICVITGGSNGIGRCLVQAFAEEGANVAWIDCDEKAGKELHTYLKGNHLFFAGDVANHSDLQTFVREIQSRYSKIDFLIHNACLSKGGLFSCDYDSFNYVLHVGVSAPYELTRLLLSSFRENGSVINISSSRAFQSQPDTESYSAAKGGITALTHAMAVTLAGRVRVNGIAPGWIETSGIDAVHTVPDQRQHPSGRVGIPQDIVHTVFFLCDPRNSFVNGETIVVDGGMSKQMIYHDDFGWKYSPEKEIQ